MFFNYIKDVDEVPAQLNVKHVFIFVPRLSPNARFLDFRSEAKPIVDQLIKRGWNYTVLASYDCLVRMNILLDSDVQEGIVVVKYSKIDRSMRGFDLEKFHKMVDGFDENAKPVSSKEKAAPGCNCLVL